ISVGYQVNSPGSNVSRCHHEPAGDLALEAQVPLHHIGRRRLELKRLRLINAQYVFPKELKPVGERRRSGRARQHDSAAKEGRLVRHRIAIGLGIKLGKKDAEASSQAGLTVTKYVPCETEPRSKVHARRIQEKRSADGGPAIMQNVPHV